MVLTERELAKWLGRSARNRVTESLTEVGVEQRTMILAKIRSNR